MQTRNPILAARLSLGMTQSDFAKALGTTQATISRWESDKLPISQLVKLAVDGLVEKHKNEVAA